MLHSYAPHSAATAFTGGAVLYRACATSLCSLNFSRTSGRTSGACWMVSRKRTSLSSSRSPRSSNQDSMGMPLSSCSERQGGGTGTGGGTDRDRRGEQRGAGSGEAVHACSATAQATGAWGARRGGKDHGAHLVAEGVRAVVHQHRLGQVAAQHVQVLEVVAVHVQAGVAVEAVVDEAGLGVQQRQQLLRVHLQRDKGTERQQR